MTQNTRLQELDNLREEAIQSLEHAQNAGDLEQWRIAHLGRQSKLTQFLRSIGGLEPEGRRFVGAAGNELRSLLDERFAERQRSLQAADLKALAKNQIDISLPSRPVELGRYHPLTIVLREITDVFVKMGFQIVEGPEVELDHYNFELLNIPKDHPARDMFDTLWIDKPNAQGEYDMLLRTHTSPMQARIMLEHQPPIRVIVPGKVYRYEATDTTHETQFHQVEGLVVDKGITFANLKHTLYEFVRHIFGARRQVRFRCDYFPFVEPGVDMSIDCFACDGRGDADCRICRGSGWIEILGAGMVHPNVLRSVGYDPDVYTGFAFGMGPERIAMLKWGIDDIRLFYGNDPRFLKQFG